MSVSIQDVQDKIRICTGACIEDTRNTGINWLRPRRAFEPNCEQNCREKYAGELTEVEKQNAAKTENIDKALFKQLSGDNSKLYQIIGATFIFLIIIAIILY